MASRTIIIGGTLVIILAGLASAETMGLYFSETTYTEATAHADVTPGVALASHLVVLDSSEAAIAGYEVQITCTAADFAIPFGVIGGMNSGTSTNQIVQLYAPVPVAPEGTVLTTLILTTGSTAPEEIMFGPSEPSSLPDGLPVVDYGQGNLVACDYPFGSEVVAWLNSEPVATEATSLSEIKSLFR